MWHWLTSAHIFLSRVQPLVYSTECPPCQDDKLCTMISLGLMLLLSPSNCPLFRYIPASPCPYITKEYWLSFCDAINLFCFRVNLIWDIFISFFFFLTKIQWDIFLSHRQPLDFFSGSSVFLKWNCTQTVYNFIWTMIFSNFVYKWKNA